MTDRPLRIAVVTGTFHPEPGGPPTYLYHLLPELVARGHAIRVLTYGEADAPTDYPYAVQRISRRQRIPRRLVAFSNVTNERHELAPGLYGLSNALLDTPWPKVGAGKTALQEALAHLPDEHGVWALLRDDRPYPDHILPATGVPLEWERLLSAAFIRGTDYGTRSSTVLTVSAGGVVTFDEQSWLPGGENGERRRYRYAMISTRV
jgi:hypothetical protein